MWKRALVFSLLFSCQPAADGSAGGSGPQGPQGPQGPMGAPGKDGAGAAGSSVKSGSRIKAQWSVRTIATEDGAVVETATPVGQFYDSKLDVVCGRYLAEDGQYRCLPSGVASYFEDSACTKPFEAIGKPTAVCGGPVPPASPPPKYVRVQAPPASGCDPQQGDKVFPVGAEVSIPDSLFNTFDGSNCKPVAPANIEQIRKNERFFATGARVAPSEFVTITDQTKQRME